MVTRWQWSGLLIWASLLAVSLFGLDGVNSSDKRPITEIVPTKNDIQRFREVEKRINENGPILEINVKQYMRWVIPNDVTRIYDAVVLYTVKDELCDICSRVRRTFTDAVNRLKQHGGMQLKMSDNKITHRPLLIFKIDMHDSREIVYLHDFRSGPNLALINITNLEKTISKDDHEVYLIPKEDIFVINADSQGKVDLEEYLIWLNSISDTKIPIEKPLVDRIGITGLLVIVLCVISTITWRMSELLRTHPWIMAIGAIVIQWLSTSGVIFSSQRGFHLFGYNQKSRQREYMTYSGRSQYAGEGLVCGLFSVIFSCALLLAVDIAKKKKRGSSLIRGAVFIALLMIAYTVGEYVFHLSGMKDGLGSTNPAMFFFPPDELVRGPLTNDRGNSL